MERLFSFIDESTKLLDERKGELEEAKQNLIYFLQSKFVTQIDYRGLIINGRVKDSFSLKEKIIRKNYFNKYNNVENFIAGLPDLIGVRIVCLLIIDEKKIFDKLKSIFTETIEDNYMIIPDSNNEGSFLMLDMRNQPEEMKNGKDIYRISGKWVAGEKEYNVELQIKSLANMLWGEIEHMLFYKNYTYLVEDGFYKEIMDSTYKLLVGIDSQLKTIKNQFLTNEEDLIEEIRRMTAKFIYLNYNQQFCRMIDCDIDLRQVYDFIVLLHFNNNRVSTSDEALQVSSRLIDLLGGKIESINRETFRFDEYRSSGTSSEEVRRLEIFLDRLTKSANVYWLVTVGLYKLLENESYSYAIEKLSSDLIRLFDCFIDCLDTPDNAGIRIFQAGIIGGFVNAFITYPNLDMFTKPSVNIICDCLISFVEERQGSFIINDTELHVFDQSAAKEIIQRIVALRILSALDKEIDIDREDIKWFETVANTQLNIPWKPDISLTILQEILLQGRSRIKLDERIQQIFIQETEQTQQAEE